MATQDKKPTQPAAATLTADNFKDLAKTKAAMKVIDSGISFDGVIVQLQPKVLERAIIEGVYRLLSADTAKVPEADKPAQALAIVNRLQKGYWTATEEKNAGKVVSPTTGGKKPAFGRLELMAEIRAQVPKKDQEIVFPKLDQIAAYDDEKFALFLTAQSAKPESLVSKAIAELTKKAEAKAAKELEAKLADLIDL